MRHWFANAVALHVRRRRDAAVAGPSGEGRLMERTAANHGLAEHRRRNCAVPVRTILEAILAQPDGRRPGHLPAPGRLRHTLPTSPTSPPELACYNRAAKVIAHQAVAQAYLGAAC